MATGTFCQVRDDATSKDSGEVVLVPFDYNTRLGPLARLTDAGTFVVDPADGRLTLDEAGLLADERGAQCRLSGGKPGKTYTIRHVVTTNETPAQTFEQRLSVFIVAGN
jgi:hypothetical protein